MTPEEYESKLTAYALGDPSLTLDERNAIEASLSNDPAARQQVEETKQIAAELTASLAVESDVYQRTSPHENVVIPSTVHKTNNAIATKKPRRFRIERFVLATTAIVAVGLVITYSWIGNNSSGTFNYVSAKVNNAKESPLPKTAGEQLPYHMQDSIKTMHSEPLRTSTTANEAGEHSPSPDGGFQGNRQFTGDGNRFAGGGTGIGGGGFAKGGGGRGAFPSTFSNPSYGGNVPSRQPVETVPTVTTQPSNDFSGANRFEAELENKFVTVEGQNALSTFGVDVDTASYSIVRKFLQHNQRPPAAAVRLEEMVNYFPYRDPAPEGKDPYRVSVEIAECPWQPTHKLARIGVKAKVIDKDKRPKSNLVFLIDVSGSMDEPNRLPWVKQAMTMLVDQLNENDRVAIVVYASACGVILDSTNATNKAKILEAISGLQAGGSTNGGSGIQMAYDVAVKNFVEGGTNRVILCTDGDWNVGTTSTTALMELIESKRKTGVFLSVLGFGMGNLRDEMMVKLAGKGNGNYAYIDELKEARKVLVEQMGGTLVTVAKDVKIQVEFNPARVASYRLLGYEKRALAAKDFADDRKDAGEMGAGHVVTALYELVPTAAAALPAKAGEELKYQAKPDKSDKAAPVAKGIAREAFTLKLRHKMPDSDVSTLRELPVLDVTKPYAEASEDFRFSAAVASFAMLLRDSPHKGVATYGMVSELARAAKSYDPSEYRAEFIQLVEKAKQVIGSK